MDAGFNCSTTAKQSISGICTSRNTRPGARFRMAETADAPLCASPTISMSGSPASSVRMRSRASGSSSTIRTRMYRLRMRGYDDPGAKSARRRVAELELGFGAVQLVQPRTRVRNPDALSDFAAGAGTVVGYFDHERPAFHLSHDVDASPSGARGDAVAHGVLHQGLKDQVRNHQVEGAGCDGATDFEAVAEPDLLDLEVFIEVLHLTPYGDLLHAGAVQREPQEIAEARNHTVGAFHITIHERRDGVQRIEEEVRLQLHL